MSQKFKWFKEASKSTFYDGQPIHDSLDNWLSRVFGVGGESSSHSQSPNVFLDTFMSLPKVLRT